MSPTPDPDGKEQWLFDGFIFLESQDVDRPDSGAYSFMTGVLRDTGVSAGKEQWQELIDYYFTKGNCVDALEQAVEEASARLGKAPCKRRVIMMIPIRSSTDTTSTRPPRRPTGENSAGAGWISTATKTA